MIIYLVIIFIFIYCIIYRKETYINYRKCKKNMNMSIVKKIKEILGNDFKYNYFDWNLFIPCGYTNVESELNSLNIKRIGFVAIVAVQKHHQLFKFVYFSFSTSSNDFLTSYSFFSKIIL